MNPSHFWWIGDDGKGITEDFGVFLRSKILKRLNSLMVMKLKIDIDFLQDFPISLKTKLVVTD